jgi:hypothetical protein
MTVARIRLAPAGGTAGSPYEPPSPSSSRRPALGRAHNVGRGDGNHWENSEIDP